MPYFKHSELVNRYHVSLKTVHNWIDAARSGKLDLALHEQGSRTYIANTSVNTQRLLQLAEKGKKYRNATHQKTVSPKQEFYKIFSRRQILDIITKLSVNGEIPREYNYMQDGATNWDNWLKRLASEATANELKGTLELFRENLPNIHQLIAGYGRVNIVDLGVGNAYPVKDLLASLLEKGVLHRYIGIDISPAMLEVAKHNIHEWFGDKVAFEGHVRDITYERFDDLLVDDMLDEQADKTINIVLLLGGTPANFPVFSDVFTVVHGSLSAHDILICSNKTDTEAARRYFDFSSVPNSKLSPNHQYLLDLLNIDPSLYEPEMGFDSVRMMRYIRVRLKSAISIKFESGTIHRTVRLEKGDTVLLLRVWHKTALEIITTIGDVGFVLLHSGLTRDRQFLFTAWGIETKADSVILSPILSNKPLLPRDYSR